MALTTEQQAIADQQLEIEQIRATSQLSIQSQMVKVETVRMAKEVLVENSRSKAVNEREISAADIIAYATVLVSYINN